MSGARFLPKGQIAHPRVARRPASGHCLGCGDPIPRRRKWCVECATNRDAISAKKRAYYERNRAKIAAGKRAYRERNRAKIAAGKRAYYERNRAKIAAGQRAYYQARHHCHRCGTPLEPKPGRPPRLCPRCKRKS